MTILEKLHFSIRENRGDNEEVTETWDALYDLLKTAVGENIECDSRFYDAICAFGRAEREQAFAVGFSYAIKLVCEIKAVDV